MRVSTHRLAGSLSAIFMLLAFPVTDARANAKVCRNQEQRYAQIERQASSIEINLALFSAADKGCLDLAKRLLEEGASVEARDRLGAMPLARAAAAGEAMGGRAHDQFFLVNSFRSVEPAATQMLARERPFSLPPSPHAALKV